MTPIPPPRLYAIVATKAPVALVFRRGPSDWYHLLRWDLEDGSIEPGVWVRKKLFPERCDLSPDGSLMLFYLAGSFPPRHPPESDAYYSRPETGRHGVYGGISRVPWLFPLVQWDLGDTWSRGVCFGDGEVFGAWGQPSRYFIEDNLIWVRGNENHAFINERRRGWREAADCQERTPDDVWDENRNIILEKARPGGTEVLRLEGGAHDPQGPTGRVPKYKLRTGSGGWTDLTSIQWADWDHRGRLLVATSTGQLRSENMNGERHPAVVEHDLHGISPDPKQAPEWAKRAT